MGDLHSVPHYDRLNGFRIREFCRRYAIAFAFVAIMLALTPKSALAQTDEIQVYTAEVAPPGKINVMVHSNFIASGHKEPAFPGGLIPNRSANGAVEWAFGVKDWFEQGVYFPVYSIYSKDRGGTLNGFKLRELFVLPHANERKLFYGVNFEFSVNYTYWESRHITSEVRPIVGLHLHKWDVIYNPILDTDYAGGFGNLEYVPATRIAYNLNDKWALALEEYADLGPVRHFVSGHDAFHEVWAVLNHDGKYISIETGVGAGVTNGADKLTFKLMLAHDLN